MITHIVLYATLGTLMSALGHAIDDWGFWSVMGLFWASDALSRRRGVEDGVALGIDSYRKMNPEQRADINKIMDSE
jgi:hypothetical protein